MDEGHCADVQAFLVCIGRANAVRLQALRNHPQEDAQHHIEHWPVALHEVTKPLGNRQHPLAHRQAGEYVVAQVCRRLHHPPRGARGADSPAFAGEGYKVVVPTVAAASAGKAMGKDAALKILRVAYRPCRRLVVRLDLHLVVRLLGFGSSERGCSSRLHLAAGSRLSRHAVTIYAPCCIGADECADDNLPFETRPANILRRQVTTET